MLLIKGIRPPGTMSPYSGSDFRREQLYYSPYSQIKLSAAGRRSCATIEEWLAGDVYEERSGIDLLTEALRAFASQGATMERFERKADYLVSHLF
jgi:hypothetical protein